MCMYACIYQGILCRLIIGELYYNQAPKNKLLLSIILVEMVQEDCVYAPALIKMTSLETFVPCSKCPPQGFVQGLKHSYNY